MKLRIEATVDAPNLAFDEHFTFTGTGYISAIERERIDIGGPDPATHGQTLPGEATARADISSLTINPAT